MTILTTNPTAIDFSLVIGGFALFIYGVTTMSDGFKNLAGSKVRLYIEKYTSTTLMAIIVGALVTAILQSSTAVTVISISLVRGKFMKLEQAIGITIGANIGTTFTSILIGLNIEAYAYYIIFAGVLLFMLAKKESLIIWGRILLGFGLIFVGLDLMGSQLKLIAQLDNFETLMLWLSNNPWLALGGGAIVTAVAQSSTVVIGVVQKLFAVDGISAIASVAFIFGANIGTCLTAVLASIGGGSETKRAAWFHAVFNIIGSLIGMLFIVPFMQLISWSISFINGSSEMYIANAHFLFNLMTTIVIFPFVNQCVKLLQLLIHGKDEEVIQVVPDFDETFITELPEQAVALMKDAVLKMSDVAKTTLHATETYLNTKDIKIKNDVLLQEEIINDYDTKISSYLIKMAQRASHSAELTNAYYSYLQVVKHLERIGDVSQNLFEFYEMAYNENEIFSEEALEDLNRMYAHIYTMIDDAMNIFKDKNSDKVNVLESLEERLDTLEYKARQAHFTRQRDGRCTTTVASSVYIDILSGLERIGDHTVSIAEVTLDLVEHHE